MSLLIQIYEIFRTNKHYTLMKTTFVPSVLVNTLSAPAQRMLLHVVCELKTGKTYEESQLIKLEYLHFVNTGILSKNAFYKAIKELKERNILYDSERSKEVYFVNYYYINAMNPRQWNQFLVDVRLHRDNNTAKAMFKGVEFGPTLSGEDLITYEQLYGSVKNSRHGSID